MPGLLLFAILWWNAPALAEFVCAGSVSPSVSTPAAKPARISQSGTTGTRQALVLFARFSGEAAAPVPDWGSRLFDPSQPGSFSHYYDTMSFGALRVRGEVGPRVYPSSHPVASYLADDSTQVGQFGRFSLEILTQADADLDFARFDNDGPDGVPDSGDDDGVVDAVFIVLAAAPTNFLVGAATGVPGLGFGGETAADPVIQGRELITADRSASGQPIRISADQGTIQQGRSLAEAVGSMCHEYGHVLGLPDLYNVDFLRQPGAPPEADGAGVGAWCLMGWGALGWEPGDGPNSLGAWSRARLGWAQLREPTQAQAEMVLEEVGAHGQVYQLPLSGRESFLLEYRRRSSTWYDRHLPAEGVLIWHVERTLAEGDQGPRTRVDLECADGRWQEAGYPLGQTAAPREGGTNLDFWAHDTPYAQAHAGNLGDQTDPFDGVRFTAFTPQTNPAAVSHDGMLKVRLEGIRLAGGVAYAQVQANPLRVELTSVGGRTWTVAAGAEVPIPFRLANLGGVRATGLRVRLRGADPQVEILDPEMELADLAATGQWSLGSEIMREKRFPRIRFVSPLAAAHTATIVVEIVAGEEVVAAGQVSLTAVPSWRVWGTVQSEGGAPLGNVPIEIEPVAAPEWAGGTIATAADGSYQIYLPEGTYTFRVRPPLESPLTEKVFANVVISQETRLDLVLAPKRRVWGTVQGDGGEPLGNVPIEIKRVGEWAYRSIVADAEGGYQLYLPEGTYTFWVYPPPEGPWGEGRFENVVITQETRLDLVLPRLFSGSGWRRIGPDGWIIALAIDPVNPQTLYAGGDGLYKSTDGGTSWNQVADFDFGVSALVIDPMNPQTLYAGTGGQGVFKSVDGGSSWNQVADFEQVRVLVIDPVNPQTLYAGTGGQGVFKSVDGGSSWVPLGPSDSWVYALVLDPLNPQTLYADVLYADVAGGGHPAVSKSEDGGNSWNQIAEIIYAARALAIDPMHPQTLYVGGEGIYKSTDGGSSWKRIAEFYNEALAIDPMHPQTLYAGTMNGVDRSEDGGSSWVNIGPFTASVFFLALEPRSPQTLYAGGTGAGMHALTLEPATAVESLPAALPPAYALAQNFPNPFNPSTTIRFSLPAAVVVTLKVYDIQGQKVATLVNGEARAAGAYAVAFDASALASGVYFYRLEAGAFHQMRKMTVLR